VVVIRVKKFLMIYCLATIHLLQTTRNRQTDRRQTTTRTISSIVT